jgi:hypothetical protein
MTSLNLDLKSQLLLSVYNYSFKSYHHPKLSILLMVDSLNVFPLPLMDGDHLTTSINPTMLSFNLIKYDQNYLLD